MSPGTALLAVWKIAAMKIFIAENWSVVVISCRSKFEYNSISGF